MTPKRVQKGTVPAFILAFIEKRGGVTDVSELYNEHGRQHGSLSPAVARLCIESKRLKRSVYGDKMFIRLAHIACPNGHIDIGHQKLRTADPCDAPLDQATAHTESVWITDKPGEFPICCVVDGKPWFFTIDAVKQLYSQFKLLEGAFK